MENNKKRVKVHYGWWIVLCCCLNSFTTGQMTTGLVSVFALPVCAALGCARSEFMFLTTCYAVAYMIGSPLAGKLIQNEKLNINFVMTILTLICVGGIACYAIGLNLFWYYVGGACIGISLAGINGVNYGYFIGNWTAGRVRGRVMSINSCMQGFAGMIWPLCIAGIISAYGYHAGYWACALIVAVFALPGALVIFKRHPEDKGLEPIGYRENDEHTAAAVQNADQSKGMTLNESFKNPWIYLMFATVLALSFIMGFKSNISGIAKEGLAATGMSNADVNGIATFMLTVLSASSLFANALAGITIDKFGIRAGSLVWLIITMLFPIFLVFCNDSALGLYAGAACFGCHTACLRTTMPILVRDLFGPKDYANIYGWINAGKGLSTGIGSTLVALVFDIGGSYAASLWFAEFLVFMSIVLIVAGSLKVGKMPWNSTAKCDA